MLGHLQIKMKSKILIFLISSLLYVSTQRLRIPNRLIYCYRGNFTEHFYPSSMPMLIDIIRKIEAAFPTSIDLRHLSSRLFHDLRIDGIQRSYSAIETEDVTAYGVRGPQTHKNRVMQQMISNVSGDLHYEDILTPEELCLLHKLISSSVESHEMHNELQICPWQILNTTSHISNVQSTMPQSIIPDQRHVNNHTVIGPNFSRCPLELGVAYSDYGAIHIGNIIAAVASGMQPQNIRISDFVAEYREKDPFANLETMEETDNRQKIGKIISALSSVDNTYASGLAGDLAEVILFQGPIIGANFTIGFAGLWNDTEFPRLLHLNGSQNGFFHLTDSEILSGLDSLFISQQVSAWASRIKRLRLSQILDMYYQHQGISIPTIQSTANNQNVYKGRPSFRKTPVNDDAADVDVPPHRFDGKTLFRKAFNYKTLNEELNDDESNYLSRFTIAEGINSVCHRQRIIEMIDVDKLKDETYNFIQILEMVTRTPIISQNLLKDFTNIAVDRVLEYSRKLVTENKNCDEIPIAAQKSAIDLTVIIEGSRTQYENMRLINSLADLVGVSKFGSYISVVHGGNGRYLVNRTNEISNIFWQLRNNSFVNPASLSLSTALGSIMLQLQNQSLEEKASGTYLALPKVVLVISQLQRVSQMDFESAQRILLGSMLQFPDLYFVFLANDINSFMEMTARDGALRVTSGRMLIETAERYRFIQGTSTALTSFKKPLADALNSIPKRIISPFCRDYSNSQRNLIRDEFEDYATPNMELKYRISPYYLYGSAEVRVRFQNVGYGDLTICMARNQQMSNRECRTIQDIENTWFNVTQPCTQAGNEECLSIYFTVIVDTSYIRCTEYSCRFPDDVRFNVKPDGLRCELNEEELGVAATIKLNFFLIILFFIIIKTF